MTGCVVIGDVDDQRLDLGHRERVARDMGELGVDQQQLGFAVIEDEGDGFGIETDVDRVGG